MQLKKNTIWKIIKCALMSMLTFVALFLLFLRIAGFTPYNVETKSMEPDFPPGTLLYVRSVDFDDIKVSDVITYVNEAGSTVTHRVMSINKEDESLRTRGDANEYEDIMPVYKENIVGKVYFKIPYAGKISAAITNLYQTITSKGETYE